MAKTKIKLILTSIFLFYFLTSNILAYNFYYFDNFYSNQNNWLENNFSKNDWNYYIYNGNNYNHNDSYINVNSNNWIFDYKSNFSPLNYNQSTPNQFYYFDNNFDNNLNNSNNNLTSINQDIFSSFYFPSEAPNLNNNFNFEERNQNWSQNWSNSQLNNQFIFNNQNSAWNFFDSDINSLSTDYYNSNNLIISQFNISSLSQNNLNQPSLSGSINIYDFGQSSPNLQSNSLINPSFSSAGGDCSNKYFVERADRYIRKIIFPWFAVGQGWETRIVAFSKAHDLRVDVSMNFIPNFSEYTPQSPHILGRINFPLIDNLPEETPISGVVGGGGNVHLTNTSDGSLITGIVVVEFWAKKEENPCKVNFVFDNLLYAQLTFLSKDVNGNVFWQVSAPGYFVDQLYPRWVAPISISANQPDGRQFESFEDPSFAIANAGDFGVKVRIRIFNNFGRPWLNDDGSPRGINIPEAINNSWYRQYQERCLTRYIILNPNSRVLANNFSATIREFFRSKREDQEFCGENPIFGNFPDQGFMGPRGYPEGTYFGAPFGFWGFIEFDAINEDGSIDKNAKIIPLVIQRIGNSLNNVQLMGYSH